MKQKIVSSLIVFVFVFSILGIAFVPTATSTAELTDYETIDVGPRLRATEGKIDPNSIPEITELSRKSFTTSTGYHEVGDLIIALTYDDYLGYVFFDWYELKAIGTVAEVWLQVDRTWYYQVPEPPANPTNPPIVTDAQIEYILEEFETNIYPEDTEYFGTPDFHDGTYSLLEAWGYVPPGYYYEETGRNVIMISNVRDKNYYEDYPYYIAGFYWSAYEAYFDRNIINIDAYDWEHRVGPEGTEWIPGEYVTRPYLYEAIFAHEYQHLIHADYNPGDDTFMNEACSMFAEILCGYGADWSSINSYLYTPDNSLTVWEDQTDINILADYGAVQLWATYLNDHYGEELIGYFVQAGIPGVEGINNALAHFGFTETFDDVYHDWRLANLLRTDFPGCGKYNYETIDMQMADPIFTHEISGLPVPSTKGTDFGTTETILGYDTGCSLVGPYGSDYIIFEDWKQSGLIEFDGDDIALLGWRMIDGVWWSGQGDVWNAPGDLLDAPLVSQEVYVDPVDPTLELTTYWDIEDFWDFGFVQVSTDGGETWTSLENAYTTYDHDPSAHPDIIANLPGLTSWSGFITPDGWVTMEFDLGAYQGETVLIGFRYMTDWFTTYGGWYISDASVSGEALTLTPVYPEADFMVTAVYAFVIGGYTIYLPADMRLSDDSELGIAIGLKKPSYTILVVSNIKKGLVDYEFSANRLHGRFWKNIDYFE